MAGDGAISAAIPSPLLTEIIKQHRFESLLQHIQSRLSYCSFATGIDPRYITFSCDTMVNLSFNHDDTRMVLNREIGVDKESETGFGCKR